MMTGLLRPDAGEVHIGELDVWRSPVEAKAMIGVLPEDLALFERLTGTELLTYNGLLRRMDPVVIAARAKDLLEVLGLRDAAGVLVVDYSHGMRKKIALAAALLHSPRMLFLDEPFEAIDPVSARTIRSVLERFTEGGNTVVFSSHVMELVERLCDRVAVMHLGRLVADGPIDEVRQGRSLEDVFVDLVGAGPSAQEQLGWLGSSST
jgi:ABC-2 type transport system ATP-binding protein